MELFETSNCCFSLNCPSVFDNILFLCVGQLIVISILLSSNDNFEIRMVEQELSDRKTYNKEIK